MNAVVARALTIEDFETGRIDPKSFDHEAHIYVGWLYVQRYELPEAISRFDAAIRRFTIAIGAEGKYHATITWFYLLLIAQRHNEGESWATFYKNNRDITKDSKATLERYYSADTLNAECARRRFVLPDNLTTNVR